MRFELKKGNVITVKKIVTGSKKLDLTYTAPKGKRFVAILIDLCDDGAEVDPEALMNSMGWFYKDEEND